MSRTSKRAASLPRTACTLKYGDPQGINLWYKCRAVQHQSQCIIGVIDPDQKGPDRGERNLVSLGHLRGSGLDLLDALDTFGMVDNAFLLIMALAVRGDRHAL